MKLRKNDEKLFTHVNDVTIPCLKPTYEKSTFLVKNGPSHRTQPERLLVATFHAQNASWKPHKKFLYTAVIFLVSREKHCLLLHIIVCACPGKSFRKAQKMSSYVGKNHSLKVPKIFSALRRKRFLREELNFCCFFHVCFFVLSKYVVIRSLLGS